MKPPSKRPAKRQNIAASFFEDLRDEPVEIPSFIAERIAAENSNQNSRIESASIENLGSPIKTQEVVLNASLNQGQSEDKVETKLETNQGQSEDKVETSRPKSRDIKSKSRDKVESQPRTLLETKWGQSEDKVETKPIFSSLVGLRRKIIVFLYEESLAARSFQTEVISIEHIARGCETTVTSAKKTLQRLEQEGFFARAGFKDGRGGGTRYQLAESVFQDLLRAESEDKLGTNWRQTRDKVESQVETEPRTSLSSSSRDLFLSNSTTTQTVENSNAQWLESLDLSSLKNFGVTRETISRAFQLNPELKPEQVEDLVWRFGEYAKDPKNRIQNARGFFLDLAKQAASGLTPLDHIETPRERMLREYVEKQKEARAQREALEKAAFDFDFEAWLGSLSAAKRDELVPPTGIIESGSKVQSLKLKEVFRESVWPSRRERIARGESPVVC